MVRVLHFMNSLQAAGLETIVVNYFKEMDKSKVMYDFCIIGSLDDNYYEEYLTGCGCRIYKINDKSIFKRSFKKKLKELLLCNRYDIIHIDTGYFIKAVIAKIAKKCGVKNIVAHCHNMCDLSKNRFASARKLLEPFYRKKISSLCNYRFACSRMSGEHMYVKDFTVIRNAIDLKKFQYNNDYRNELRNQYSISENTLIIGHVGRLAYPKNQLFLIKLIPYIKQFTTDFKFMFVGEGEDRQYLETYVKDNNLEEYVLMVGNVGEEVYKYYSVFDIFVFPSFNEGLSLVNIEAQANGLNVIASNTISAEHKVTDGYMFMPIEDTEQNFAAWCDMILSNFGKRRDNYQRLVEEGYDIKTEANKLQDLYLSMVK